MLKIFPIIKNQEGVKFPAFKNWPELASSDPIQHAEWVKHYGQSFHGWAIPTGSINNILVIDVDVKHGDGFESLRALGLSSINTKYQKTPSGGVHFVFKYNPDKPLTNAVGFIPSVDIRTDRGFIYWHGDFTTHQIAEVPEWVYTAYDKKFKASNNVPTTPITHSLSVSTSILIEALNAIRNAPEGESNNVLNTQSFKVGQCISDNTFTRDFVEQELFKAAKDRGKPDFEARATIKSGLDGALKKPSVVDLPSVPPVPLIPIPPMPVATRWTPDKSTISELFAYGNLRKPQLFKDWSSEDIQLFNADGGTGKTTLKLYEAVCMALGMPFLGFECLRPGGKTLFITGEDSSAKLKAILGAMLRQMKLDTCNESVSKIIECIHIKKDSNLCMIAKEKSTGFLTTNNIAFEAVKQAVEDIKPDVIVFDPIASFWGSEAALNDMGKAVTKFIGDLQEISNASIEMINHIGKVSSKEKDVSQFTGRGGTGIVSHSRIVKTMLTIDKEEYRSQTSHDLTEKQSAMIVHCSKFSDGSPLLNNQIIIMREGYLFTKVEKREENANVSEALIEHIQEQLLTNKNLSKTLAIQTFVKKHKGCNKSIAELELQRLIDNERIEIDSQKHLHLPDDS